MLKTFFGAGLFLLVACSTTSTGKEVKTDTKDKRDLPVLIYAKAADASANYYINLRANDFFDYHDKGTDDKDQLYAGTYAIEGNNLALAFQNNYQPEGLTGKATIDKTKNEIILLAKDRSKDRRMIITTKE